MSAASVLQLCEGTWQVAPNMDHLQNPDRFRHRVVYEQVRSNAAAARSDSATERRGGRFRDADVQ
jgi:hypothetical protein